MEHQVRKDYDTELKAVMAYLFVGPSKKYHVEDIARKLHMEYIDFYPYVTGKRNIPIELLVRLTEVTCDTIFFDTAFAGTKLQFGFVGTLHPHTKDIIREAMEAFEASGYVAGELKGKDLTEMRQEERTRLHTYVSRAINEMKDVQNVLNESFKG